MPKKMGRPPYIPNDKDRALLRIMVAMGVPVKEIGEALNVCKKTLYTHYKKDIQSAAKEINSQVVGNLFRLTKTHPAAAIFWCKTRLNWRETDEVGLQEPIKVELVRGPEPDRLKKDDSDKLN